MPLCINGVYLFGVSRIELDEEHIELFLRRKNEQSQREYRISIWYGEKRMEIYKKYRIIYILCSPYQRENSNRGIIPISNKENLYVGHSVYQ